ncbi:MAG: 2-amino-4-hydroxy-6-hydroxymethyldihydropteridine diphosphokinase, partial [Deltaproteobacteria bacterium]|nr:2-amino-4-hydroxy-6-hydroxymethyldihydropteridine diphosphokinase [Deltaproteobacteria bacterium]
MLEEPLKTNHIAYIGIGSNVGDKLDNCLKAIHLAGRIKGCTVQARSDFFRTEPVGVEGQDWYVNGAIALRVRISAPHLLKALLAIETGMGRERRRKWESRPIDLDFLFYGSHVICEKNLIVPHPHMHVRRFVLAPMVQLAPDLMHPVLKRTMA